jgi:RHS repeat-associated protein
MQTYQKYPIFSHAVCSVWDKGYRYGFNGKEIDSETGLQDYGARIYDPRSGRFSSVDPLVKSYPELTPYQFASNTPIWAIDLDGMEAYFTTDGKFDRWGEKKGKDAPVIMINKSGDVAGVTLKNNATDFKGKDITVKQFLKRSQRVWSEGGRTKETADAYAHSQDNIREKNGGTEFDNYTNMSTASFDETSKYPSYKKWNEKRGSGYDNLEGLNDLQGANVAIKAEAELLQGKTIDPTGGATQWRGGQNARNIVENAVENKTKLSGQLGLKGVYIINVTRIDTKAGVHTFFSTSPNKPIDANKGSSLKAVPSKTISPSLLP